MPGIEKIHLEDALEDSPQTRSLVGLFEEDAKVLKTYTKSLHQCCQRTFYAQRELCAATQALSQTLKSYEHQTFPLESDDSILTSTLNQFSSYLDELSSMHQILATQLSDSMMYSIGKFLQADLDEVNNMCEMMKIASTEHEASTARYMKLSKKKDNEKLRTEAVEDLYAMRRKFHQTSLHYYANLNSLQYKRKYALIEPMLGYLQAQKAFFEMGKDVVIKEEIDDFLANINASVQGVHQELGRETQKTVEQMDHIERQSNLLYYAEPPKDTLPIPANKTLAQKAAWLFLRGKQLIGTKWDRCYFFTQGGNLMCQTKDEVAGSLAMDLNEDGVSVQPVDIDDRRFVFQVSSTTTKKTVIMQAENEREREEWIATLQNIIGGGEYTVEPPSLTRTERSLSASSSSTSDPLPVPGIQEPTSDDSGSRSGPPPTPPPTPADGGFIPDAPIQFDIISPIEEAKPFRVSSKEGPPSDNNADNSTFYQTFEVRFLGSMEVRCDRGDALVYETMRQILAARALHNIFKTSDSLLVTSSDAMRVVDPSNNTVRSQFQLEDISYWAGHQDNKRLLGFITRTKPPADGGNASFVCHVFECNTSADEICHAISTATKLAFQSLMAKKAQEKESPTRTEKT